MKRKQKRESASKAKRTLRSRKHLDVKPKGQRLFRLLAYQPVSVTSAEPKVIVLQVAGKVCRFFLVPVHDDASAQRAAGGSWIHVEFVDDDPDILRATS
jgi:hypothetical protein